MKSLAILLLGLLFTAEQPAPGKADSEFDKKTNFAAHQDLFVDDRGTDALVPEAHKMIVAAVDKETAAAGIQAGRDRRRRHDRRTTRWRSRTWTSRPWTRRDKNKPAARRTRSLAN